MRDSSSNSEITRSAADIRQYIAKYVLTHSDELSDVPGVKDFVEQHGRLTGEIATAKKRGKRLAQAKEKYEPFELRIQDCRDALKSAKAEFSKQFRPLGQAAFQTFIDGSIKEQAAFSERLEVHKRVQQIQQKHDALTPTSDSGMAQKAKSFAQQILIKGKIKFVEVHVGALEKALGKKIAEANHDDSVRCESTGEVLRQVAKYRESVARCSKELHQAEAAREMASKKLCETVPIKHIESSKSFDSEMKTCKNTVRSSESSLRKAARSLASTLTGTDRSKLPKTLAAMLNKLNQASQHNVSERLQEVGDKILKRCADTVSLPMSYYGGLSKQGRMIAVAAVGLALSVLLYFMVLVTLRSW